MPTSRRTIASFRRVYQVFAGCANERTRGAACALAASILPAVVPASAAGPRALEPPTGTVSMARTPVVEIGSETRPVLARAPRRVLKVNETVRLPAATLEIPIVLGDDVARGTRFVVEGEVSVRDPEATRTKDIVQMRGAERFRVDADPLVVEAGEPGAKLSFAVPDELLGEKGLLTVLARELPAEPDRRDVVGPWEVESGDRLELGFGVEPAGWNEGHPPVRFRVVGVPEEGDEVVLFERAIDPVRDARDRRWHDASVGLASLSGRTARFRLETEALPGADGVVIDRSFPVFANPRLRRAEPDAPHRPNLVLVSLDTLRAQSVGAYGYRHPTTPNLDRRLAAAGALVREVVVPVPFTPPSHMTMLTGLAPCVHGVENRDGILAPEDLLLAEILRHAGWATAAFTENAYVVSGAGFARGFETYVEQRASAEAAPGFAVETFGAAERWLAARPPEPFFLFLHTYQVHDPYTPPRGYRSLFGGFPPTDRRKRRWKNAERAYDQEIRYTDDLLGGFLDTLSRLGLDESTVVAVTSDHGESFGRDGWGGHGVLLYDEALLVPLVVRAPGEIPPGTVVDAQVGLVDLVPTLLDLVGVGLPRPVQGRSFAPLLRGEDDGSFEERPLVSRTTGFDITSVRTRQAKYVRRGPPRRREQLYRLDEDPGETRSVADEHPELVKAALRALDEDVRRCAEYRQRHPVTAGKDALFEQRPDWLVNRNEIERRLRSLGYVE